MTVTAPEPIGTDVPTLRTARLVLRAPPMTDLPRFAAFLAAPRAVHIGGPVTDARIASRPRSTGPRAGRRPGLDVPVPRMTDPWLTPPDGLRAALVRDLSSLLPRVDTTRLTLRPYALTDFEAMAAFYTSPRTRFMGGPQPRDRVWQIFASDIGHWALRGFGIWAIDAGDGMIGHCGLHHPPPHADRKIAWSLFDGAGGRGYALEAATAAREWAQRSLPPARLVSYIDRDNAASIRLAERLGAVREADTAAHDPLSGVWLHPVAA